jgi:hypothetical protein
VADHEKQLTPDVYSLGLEMHIGKEERHVIKGDV